MSEEEVQSILAEIMQTEIGQFLAEKAARQLCKIAWSLDLAENLAEIAAAYDLAVGELVAQDGED